MLAASTLADCVPRSRQARRSTACASRDDGVLPNQRFRAFLALDELRGLDGELASGDPLAADVMQRSIGAGMSRGGPAPERGLSFWVFDSFSHPELPFRQRHRPAARAVRRAGLASYTSSPDASAFAGDWTRWRRRF